MRKQQDIRIVLHYPRMFDLHTTVRHIVAVKELIDQDMAGTLKGSLDVRVRLLDEADEEAALERYMKKHPPKKQKSCGTTSTNRYGKKSALRQSRP